MIQRMISTQTKVEQNQHVRELEQFRTLTTKLFLSQRADGRELRTIAVTSCEPKAGVTATVAKLVVAAAERLPNVIAVQYERPPHSLEPYFGRTNTAEANISESSSESSINAEAAPLVRRTKRERILFASIDRCAPEHGHRCTKPDQLLEQLLAGPDAVIADLPPIADDTATLSIVSKFDGVLLVVQAEHTRRFELRRVHQELQRQKANVVGVVFTNSDE